LAFVGGRLLLLLDGDFGDEFLPIWRIVAWASSCWGVDHVLDFGPVESMARIDSLGIVEVSLRGLRVRDWGWKKYHFPP